MTFLKNIYNFFLSIYHYILAWKGNIIYRRPSRHIMVIGVTGTKGKTTTVELLSAVFRAAGKRVASHSSVYTRIHNNVLLKKGSNSMPGRFFLKRFLRRAVNAKCDVAIIEVTSQGVVQHRARFIDFDVCVFLNLAPEHIESHGSFEAYRDAKIKFFKDAARDSKKPQKYFVMNKRDPASDFFHAAIVGTGESIFFEKDMTQQFALSNWLSTDFNRMNAAAAIAVARVFHISDDNIGKALKEFRGISGRMEYVQEKPFAVVVDYAHTPDSFEAVFKALKERHTGRLICVISSTGGGRDTWKRPVLGSVADSLCDEIIVTNEDPYNEDPQKIIDDVARGVVIKKDHCLKILERRDAIQKALSLAKPGDAVVLTGKGAERSIHIAHGKEIPWSDQNTAKEILS